MYWYYVITIAIIGIDQLSKWMVVKNMEIYDQITVIENFFYLTSHRNTGAAWGILEGKMNFFYIITVIVVIGVIFYLHKYGKENKLLAVSLSFVLGGAIGNFIDRILHKEVVDFLDFIIFNYDYPIFNIADSALVVGVILLLIFTFMDERKERVHHDTTKL
ncbi:signal peptidase II [Virgibacillus alimentarius]|uniref:Lipoprotein signal peptidase n=1 Tax=Virgibacillus alimentarius TaxID=698769 RepID=A0ABS4S5E2_9BACI|nr:signal peptidase II [Virgibacillus alimentarius]MBP2256129.1 signal peptidase II [Virgibacillus alimentarius]